MCALTTSQPVSEPDKLGLGLVEGDNSLVCRLVKPSAENKIRKSGQLAWLWTRARSEWISAVETAGANKGDQPNAAP